MILSKYKLIVIENIKARFISTVTFDPESRFGRATDIVSSKLFFSVKYYSFIILYFDIPLGMPFTKY